MLLSVDGNSFDGSLWQLFPSAQMGRIFRIGLATIRGPNRLSEGVAAGARAQRGTRCSVETLWPSRAPVRQQAQSRAKRPRRVGGAERDRSVPLEGEQDGVAFRLAGGKAPRTPQEVAGSIHQQHLRWKGFAGISGFVLWWS